MADPRILILATMTRLQTTGGPQEPTYTVTATCKGLSYTTKVKSSEMEAGARALQGLLNKVDALAEIADKLGPKPAPMKPRGIAVTRARQAEEHNDGTVMEIPDQPTPASPAVSMIADPSDEDGSVDLDL